jgi:ABC-type multidrug transport system, ATPase component
MTSAIETRGLTKVFGKTKAVDSLDLHVPEGSIYGFLGPNGAGKTTTIKMLAGLSKPTLGQIKVFGREVSFGNRQYNDEIGFLPDVPNFYNWMNAVEFLRFTGEIFSIDKNILSKRIGGLIELVGLSGVKKRIGGYSRGMKQRLGIAQALINNPRVVFLDEPTSALDPIGRKEVMDIMKTLSGKVTVFFSTHILADVERICDRVVILDHGRAVLEDKIEDLRSKYSMHVLSVETDAGEKKQRIMDEIRRREWTELVSNGENGEFSVRTRNMEIAQRELPGIIAREDAALKKFIVLEPTLEDIFMKVVDNK